MRIRKTMKRLAKWSAICTAAASLIIPGVASAASIELTGPGSTNIITGSRRFSEASITLTGPGSTNIIRSSGSGHNVWWSNNWQSWGGQGGWDWFSSTCANNRHHNNLVVRHNHINHHVIKHHQNNGVVIHHRFVPSPHFVNNTRTNTNVTVRNNIQQSARTGNVRVSHNTVVGDVFSGDASNSASNETMVSTNSGANVSHNWDSWNNWSGSHRSNTVTTTRTTVSNTINQRATSGNVYVSGNTVVGNVYSGSASNWAQNNTDISNQ